MFKKIVLVFLVLLLWIVFIGLGFQHGFLLRPITYEDTPEAFIEAVKEKVDAEFVGNFAMVLIEDGQVSKDFFYSIDQPVTENTAFPVASISKWVTSFGVLKLVEQGKLDLDTPVDNYLTRWHLPDSEFDNSKVTIRKLLSHSSGLVDDLGYEGFAAGERVQTLEESLNKAADAPYSEGIAIVGYEPGSQYMYSGAGYTMLQLVIEEVSGQSFQEYMTQTIFEPLGMTNSTFVLSEKSDINFTDVYKADGTKRPFNKFTALAAAALLTSTGDLSKFLIANISSNNVLSLETMAQMSTPETFINNTEVYGLGPHLYSQGDANSKIIGHDGSGNNAINTAARIDLTSKNGIIVLETGHYSLASAVADEWIFWKAGIADYVVMTRNMPYVITILTIGVLIIIGASIFIIKRSNSNL